MKTFLATALVLATLAFANVGDAKPLDRFPWDWGTECPFPWSEVNGIYQVRSMYSMNFSDGKYIRLVTGMQRWDANQLRVYQYSSDGKLEAYGVAAANPSQRILSVGMQRVGERHILSKLIIRAYLQDFQSGSAVSAQSCERNRKVMTVTFCPLNSVSCTVNQNYVLLRLKE